MSIVAHQYNLMSEQLRRGIGDLNKGKLQEKALEAETEKTKFQMGLARRGLELREDANRRANELFPSQLEASQTQAKVAKAQLPKAQLEAMQYATDLKKYRTPGDEDYVKSSLASSLMPGMVQGPGGERVVTDLLKTAGYTFKGGKAYKDGKEYSQYQIDNDPDIKIVPHLVDPLDALEGMKQTAQGEIEQAALKGDDKLAENLHKVYKFADEKIKEIEADPGKAYTKRFHYALSAVVGSKNPEKYIPALKLMNEEAKVRLAAREKKPANYAFKLFTNPNTGEKVEFIVDKTDLGSYLTLQKTLGEGGYVVGDTQVGDLAAQALINLGNLKPGELLSPKDVNALRTYSQQMGEDVATAIQKMIGLDPEFINLYQQERQGKVEQGAAQEYLRQRSQEVYNNYAKSYQAQQEAKARGRDSAGTTDAAELANMKQISEDQARQKYESGEWDTTKLQQWADANGR